MRGRRNKKDDKFIIFLVLLALALFMVAPLNDFSNPNVPPGANGTPVDANGDGDFLDIGDDYDGDGIPNEEDAVVTTHTTRSSYLKNLAEFKSFAESRRSAWKQESVALSYESPSRPSKTLHFI